MDAFELMSGDHFHVILHSDKEHGLIFNRLDKTVTTIYYSDAKELSNLSSAGTIYGIVGRFLDKYLVLIKSQSRVGSLYEPSTGTEHDVFVITQVQVIDISHVKTAESSANSQAPPKATNIHRNPLRFTDNNVVSYSVGSAKNTDESGSSIMLPNRTTSEDNDFSSLPITISTNSYNTAQSRAANWNPFRLANSLKPMMPTQFIKPSVSSDHSQQPTRHSSKTDDSNFLGNKATSQSSASTPATSLHDEANKRRVEEMTKLFNNTNSFYYSPTLDLTRRFSRKTALNRPANEPMWQTADRRFFWNRFMLKDIIELSKEDADANYFIRIVLHGFVAIALQVSKPSDSLEDYNVDSRDGQGINMNGMQSTASSGDSAVDGNKSNDRDQIARGPTAEQAFQLALVSRRSVFQAGTRYRRRGCDAQGNCANFVETEQIVRYKRHFKSVIILRGSIPLFWYQTGFNYRPPPVLVKSEEENQRAFVEHFQGLFQDYETEQIIAVDCTEQTGREKALHDAYKRHMEKLREFYPKASLIEFDFHKHCSGRQCSDAQIEKNLRECGLSEELVKEVKYFWHDGELVWNQEGVFRVNCLDCSDRTNVVQRAIALKILDLQLARLGIITPDSAPEENLCRKRMQTMWTNNGNVLSTQYCGTRALFGGDRKLSGYLKDTYSSASRYYYSKFRDVYRQAAIDAMLGIETTDQASLLSSPHLKDHYELLHFEPILGGRAGSALLKDVGNRVSNRLARLKGRFYQRAPGSVNYTSGASGAGRAHYQGTERAYEATPEFLETDLIEQTLGEMSIDWPSTENMNDGGVCRDDQQQQEDECQDVFARFKNCDESFQDDDEFGQLMLSIDLAELQRLRDEEDRDAFCVAAATRTNENQPAEANGSLEKSSETATQVEEIGMTEARSIRSGSTATSENTHGTSTTST